MRKLFTLAMAVAAITFVSCNCKSNKAECEKSCACEECKCDPCECEEGGTCKCDPCECQECKCAEGCEKECEKPCEKECGECPLKALGEKLEAGDAEGISAALTEAGEKIEALLKEGKVEEAQKVGAAIKEFIDTNKEKLDAAAVKVDNIVSTISNLPAAAEAAAEAGRNACRRAL